MKIFLITIVLITLLCRNVFAENNCMRTSYHSIYICLDTQYNIDKQDDKLIIKKKTSIDQGFVVIGMSQGQHYDESVDQACRENDKIQCISLGTCGSKQVNGKMLKYIDKNYQDDIINISCFIESAKIFIIYHGPSPYCELFDEVVNTVALHE